MQVSATLIAAQQAAREARSRMQAPQPSQVSFTAALDKSSAGFSALPLKQMAAAATPAAVTQPRTAAPARMGLKLDITV